MAGQEHAPLADRSKIATSILPALRGIMSSNKRVIAHYADHEDALAFAGSKWAHDLGRLGTSCPDHFLRTRICPMFVDWNPAKQDLNALKQLDWRAGRRIPRRVFQILFGARHERVSDAPRFESVGGNYSRSRTVWIRQEQKRSPNHDRIFY